MSQTGQENPTISIVTVSYNQGQFLEENIVSVLEQGYPHVEHIIIDAGSTDNTHEILKKYDRYLNWTSEPDGGQSDGLNKGFKKATGEIIGWFNSDDKVAPGAFHSVVKFFQEYPQEIAVAGDQNIINENSQQVKVIKSREYTFDYLVNHARGITQNSIFFKRDLFKMTGYLDTNINYAMDRDFFIRVARERSIPYLPKVLGEFRIQEKSKTAKGTFYFSKDLIKIRRKYGANFFASGNLNDWYVILTEPFRRTGWLREFIQKIRVN